MYRSILVSSTVTLNFLCWLAPFVLFAQTATDTVGSDTRWLNEVTVIGYDARQKLLQTAGSVDLIDAERIQAYDQTSVVPAMNTMPGVRMEQRSPGSYRIAIRGSALRAPFGVRNIKVYWNDIPFTDPTGSTAFNLLDVINMERIEVVKGPAGSIYGAGTGGVVNINSTGGQEWSLSMPNKDLPTIEVGATVGSFGLQRYTAQTNYQSDNTLITAKYAHQQSEGYRDHTAFRRDVLEISGTFDASEARQISAHFLYADLDYQIPGGLTQEQFDEAPRQARPGNAFVMGSVESQAGVHQEYALLGISQQYTWNDRLSNLTTIYGDFSFFENPFLFDYKRDSRQGGGGRTRFYYDTNLGSIATRFTVGAEVQTATNVARNFGNRGGQPDTLNFDDELRARQATFFANATLELPYEVSLTVGLSHNRLNYDIYRLVDVALDSSYRVKKSFDPVWMPRVGLTKALSPQVAAHASVSYGFSPPALEEVRTNEGSINLGLEPERGINYELGLRGNALPSLSFDLTGFFFRLDETIVQQQSERGTTLFTNTGSTDQRGLELSATWFAIEEGSGLLSQLELRGAYTYHYFKFNNYVKEGEDFSGKRLTGVAPHIFVLSWQAATSVGLFFNGSYNHTGRIPLNDANSVYADDYHLVQAKLGYHYRWSDRASVRIFVGIDNALDQRYSLGNDLNAFGERYFQPSAERNYYGGIMIGF